jgi:hypothetical protein
VIVKALTVEPVLGRTAPKTSFSCLLTTVPELFTRASVEPSGVRGVVEVVVRGAASEMRPGALDVGEVLVVPDLLAQGEPPQPFRVARTIRRWL